MAKYVDTYWNLYWALHLGISNDCKEPEKDVTCEDDYYNNCIPPQVKEIGIRTRSQNGGSISSQSAGAKAVPTFGAILTTHKHKEISADKIHWSNPSDFDPERYINAPTSDKIDEDLCGENSNSGLNECPFPLRRKIP